MNIDAKRSAPHRFRALSALLLVGGLSLTGCADNTAASDSTDGGTTSSGRSTGVTGGVGTGTGPGTPNLPGYGELDAPISPFEDVPAIGRLSADLRDALQQAAEEAAARDVHLVVTSGWRSAEYQQKLFDDAVREYGSAEEAMAWVLPPSLTTHVTGEAVDVGFTDGADWLGRFGSRWGLCQPFANEMWHFELLTEPGGSCPQQLSNAAARSK